MSNQFDPTQLPRMPNPANNQSNTTDDFIFKAGIYVRGRAFLDSIQDVDITTFGSAALSLAGGLETGGSIHACGFMWVDKDLKVLGNFAAENATLQTLNTNGTTTSSNLNVTNSSTMNILSAVTGNVTHLSASDLTVTGASTLSSLTASSLAAFNGGLTASSATINGAFNVTGNTSTFTNNTLKLTQSASSNSASLSLGTSDSSLRIQHLNNLPIYMITDGAFALQSPSSTFPFLISVNSNGFSSNVPVSIANSLTTSSSCGITSDGVLTANQNVLIKGTQTSTLPTEGALVVAGGVGVQGRINTIGDISSQSSVKAPSLIATTSANLASLLVTSTLNATALNSASIVTSGGFAAANDAMIGGNVSIMGTADAVSGMAGSLSTQGGASITKKLRVGDLLSANNGLAVLGNTNVTGTLAASLPVYANSTLFASSITSAALVSAGGIAAALNILAGGSGSFGGNLSTQSALSAATTLSVGGDSTLAGNLSVTKNFNCNANGNIIGDLIVGGNLTAGGNATKINWAFFETNDNIICVNSGRNQIADGGFASSRFQTANNSGAGSVVLDTPFLSGTCGSTGNTTTAINLGTGASTVDNTYNAMWVLDSNNQVRKIKSYVGSSQIATIYSTADQAANDAGQSDSTKWPQVQGMDFNTVPTSSTTFKLFNRQYMLHTYIEAMGLTVIGSTPVDPTTSSSASLQNTESLKFKSGFLDGALNCDTLAPYTANGPINVGGVSVQNGKLSNVASINNIKGPQTLVIQLPDNANTPVTLPTGTFGSYQIIVTPQNATGSSVKGNLLRYNSLSNTNNVTLSSSGEQVMLKWTAGSAVQAYHSSFKVNGTGAMINYNVVIRTENQ